MAYTLRVVCGYSGLDPSEDTESVCDHTCEEHVTAVTVGSIRVRILKAVCGKMSLSGK